jgi:hypothetical protein
MTRPFLKIFRSSNDFVTQKVYFTLSACTCPGILAFYRSAGFGRFIQVPALASHWLEDCANFTPAPEETTNTIIRRIVLLAIVAISPVTVS